MSAKKDGSKRTSTTLHKKSNPLTSLREASNERKTKKLEIVEKKAEKPKVIRKVLPKSSEPTKQGSSITKTQFIPNSKCMYSNALRDKKLVQNFSTKPNNKKESTLVKPKATSTKSKTEFERPRTATLRRGSIVNHNFVGPEAFPHQVAPKPPKQENNYEDDFDSYESDFEPYQSSDSSSINLSVPEECSSSSCSSKDQEPEITNTTKLEEDRKLDSGTYEGPSTSNHKQSLDKSTVVTEKDEGFDEIKSLQYINFNTARKQSVFQKKLLQKRKRGEEILGMIKLDLCNFTLFELPTVPYEEFIRSFGEGNTVQALVQSNDDCVVESTQTEELFYEEKWTQFPCKFSCFNRFKDNTDFWQDYCQEFNGVSSKLLLKNQEIKVERLANLMLKVLQEEASSKEGFVDQEELVPFSQSSVQLRTNNEYLQNSFVQDISYSEDPNIFLTIHIRRDFVKYQSIISLWDVSKSIEDAKFYLFSHGKILVCCFATFELIVAGQSDGSICVYNLLKNDSSLPNFVVTIHQATIVSIKSFNDFDLTKRILSLDEDGLMILWDLYAKQGTIVQKLTIDLTKLYSELQDFSCNSLVVNDKRIFVGTNYGCILHYLISGDSKYNLKKFNPKQLNSEAVTSLELCPFSQNYFLASFSSGRINIYGRFKEQPLMIFKAENQRIEKVIWSQNVPFIFYAKTCGNLQVWNLQLNDLSPEMILNFNDKVNCLQLSPACNKINSKSYLVIGLENGSVFLHLLNSEHGPQTQARYQQLKTTFLNYLNRL